MDKVVGFIKSHWPVILAFAGAAWEEFGTSVMAWVAAHPHFSGAAAFLVFSVAWFKAYYTQAPPKP